MKVLGNITELIDPKFEKLGYSLTEDEDFLYVHLDGKTIATFSSHHQSLNQVNAFIRVHNTAANMEDWQKHLGNED